MVEVKVYVAVTSLSSGAQESGLNCLGQVINLQTFCVDNTGGLEVGKQACLLTLMS